MKIRINSVLDTTLLFINNTNRSVFLSGKAGTGKSSFLKRLQNLTHKRFAIVAPTGIAAINAEGVTIHSFFNLPLLPIYSNDKAVANNIKLDREKILLLQELELLVIDEVSMLRADLLDFIDLLLRRVRRTEVLFGGIQMLFIGDLLQLPPIAKGNELELLKMRYSSPYFIDSNSYRSSNTVLLQLEKVYRQTDTTFINTLNRIRENKVDKEIVSLINSYYRNLDDNCQTGYITLTTHNSKVDNINNSKLSQLPDQEYIYTAIVSGDFDEASFPTEKTLILKVGAQVMLIKNDTGKTKKYFNGKIGVIKEIGHNAVTIGFQDSDDLVVERELWRKFDYIYDNSGRIVKQSELGTFSQLPLRLAWAITIHKSQGLTFEKAVLDIADAFSPGQIYVALSRIKSLDGLLLKSRLSESAIHLDERILSFYQNNLSLEEAGRILEEEKNFFIEKKICEFIDWAPILAVCNDRTLGDHPLFKSIFTAIDKQQNYVFAFVHEIKKLFQQANVDVQKVSERVIAAATYFEKDIQENVLNGIKNFIKNQGSNFNYKKHIALARQLKKACELKTDNLIFIKNIIAEIKAGKDYGTAVRDIFAKRHASETTIKTEASTDNQPKRTEEETLYMFRSGKSLYDIAKERLLSISTIEYHLSTFIPTGEVDVLELMDSNDYQEIFQAIEADPSLSPAQLKERLKSEISLGKINAVMNYFKINLSR